MYDILDCEAAGSLYILFINQLTNYTGKIVFALIFS